MCIDLCFESPRRDQMRDICITSLSVSQYDENPMCNFK